MTTVPSLEPYILAILTAPAVDLKTVSAKRVRAQLKVNVPGLEDEWVRENKAEIDALTAAVFDRVRPEEDAQDETPKPEQSTPPAPLTPTSTITDSTSTKKRKRTVEEVADAEYARKLASELNGHNTRAGSVGKKKEPKSRRKVTKSAEEIHDSDDDETPGHNTRAGSVGKKKEPKSRRKVTKSAEEIHDSDDDETPKKKSKPRRSKKADSGDGETKKRGGYQKEYALSPALAAFTGVPALSRPQIVKKLWDHIKANSLQNPQDKREILCDEQMRSLFGVDKINMFQMNKVIGDHIINDPVQ
ncbi:unnamed protein product [Rhizoctonia solani]|uniref:DM2 domain-containing protein n=1 Tax=Rhizoctonia solani TaxID=456999 RepID=A0A8H3BMD8_9AGAM|nr:unnamed protein product [Rhizoctonia solani]